MRSVSNSAELASPGFDRDAIFNHFRWLHHLAERANVPGVLVLAVFGQDPDTLEGFRQVQHFQIGDFEGMTVATLAFDGMPHRNVYAPLVVMRPDLPVGLKGGEADIVAVLGFVIDGDSDKGRDAPVPPAEANYVIESSAGNKQYYLLLDRPLAPAEAKPIAQALQRATGAECTDDLSHVWRAAGGLNWPNAAKIARGRPREPQAVRIIKAWDTWTSVDELRRVLAPYWEDPREQRENRGPAGTKYNTCPIKVRRFHEDLRDAGWYDAGPNARARYVRSAKALSYDVGDEDGRKIFEEVICWQGKREDEGAPADAHEIETRWRDCSSLKGNTKPVTHGSLNEDAHRMLGWPKRHLARDKTAESMFGDVAVVGAPSIVPGATAGATSGGIPLLEGQLAVAEMGRPILERYIEMVGRPAAPFELQLPADHPLFELLGFALASVMAQQRVDDAASDVLAVLAAAHPPTFEVVRDNLGLNESGSLSAACARFAGKIEYEFKTKGDWIRIGRENHINSTHPANFHRLLRIMNCELRHNEWLERDEIRGERWTEWTYVDDAVVARLLTEARKNGFTPAKDFVWDTVRAFAEDTRVDPARDRLQVLETAWDRKPRLDEWLSAAFGVPADIYHRVVGRRIVGGLVRRIREPGAKIDEMAVLIGSQGISKSTAVKMLAPITDSFTDGVKLGEESKELILLLAGCAVVEVGEMSKRTTAGIEAIKVMVAKTHDRGRTVWNRAVTNRPRRNIFVGTSNADTPLMDITGNRRFLPLRCVRVDLEWMAHNRDQLIGEACALQTKGETFDLPPDTWDIAAIHQEAARERADYELLLQQWFAQDEPEEHIPPEIAPVMGRASEFVIISDLAKLLRNELRQRTSQNDVAAAMRKLGFRRTTQKLNRKAEDMWLRGEWCAHGAGMVQHVVAPPNGHHGVRHIPRGTTPPPPPPR